MYSVIFGDGMAVLNYWICVVEYITLKIVDMTLMYCSYCNAMAMYFTIFMLENRLKSKKKIIKIKNEEEIFEVKVH